METSHQADRLAALSTPSGTRRVAFRPQGGGLASLRCGPVRAASRRSRAPVGCRAGRRAGPVSTAWSRTRSADLRAGILWLREPTRWCPSTGRPPAENTRTGERRQVPVTTAQPRTAARPANRRRVAQPRRRCPQAPCFPLRLRGTVTNARRQSPAVPGHGPGATASGPTTSPAARGEPRGAAGRRAGVQAPQTCRGSSPAAPARPAGPVAAGPSDPPRSSPTVPRPTRVLAGPPGGTVSPACRDAAPSVPRVHDSTTVATATADRPWVKCHRTDGRRRSRLPSLPGRGTRSAARPLAPSEAPGPLGQSASRAPGRSARPPSATRRCALVTSPSSTPHRAAAPRPER